MKYTGTLAKPIIRKKLGFLATEDEFRAESQRVVNEMFAKLTPLAEAHGVEPGNWLKLVIAMAEVHVPGFRKQDPPGRPTAWDALTKAELRIDVDDLIQLNGELAITEALRRVARTDRWKERAGKMKVEALSQHYYAADKRFVTMLRDGRAYEKIMSKD